MKSGNSLNDWHIGSKGISLSIFLAFVLLILTITMASANAGGMKTPNITVIRPLSQTKLIEKSDLSLFSQLTLEPEVGFEIDGDVTITPTIGLTTTEMGDIATFELRLGAQPTATVTITLSSSNPVEGIVFPDALTFLTTTWDITETATITGVNDFIVDGDTVYTITIAVSSDDPAYNALDVAGILVTNLDDDIAGVMVTPTLGLVTSEDGGIDQFNITLNSEPTAPVTITLNSTAPDEGIISAEYLEFLTTTWDIAQTATITGVEDSDVDGDRIYMITTEAYSDDPLYAGISVPDVVVTNTDNDTAIFLPLILKAYPIPSSPIFTDDFSIGWYPLPDDGSSSGVENGEYLLRHTIAGRILRSVAVHPALPNAYSVEVDVRQPTGSAKYGITFEWLDNNNFYTFIVDPDNQSFVVWKYASGWVKLAEGNYTRVAVDHLKLERDGGAIRVYANDNMLAEVTDGTHTTGRVGLEIWPGSNTSSINPAEARFDNFVIQEIDFVDDFSIGWYPLPDDGSSSGVENGEYLLRHTIAGRILRSVAVHPALPNAYSVEVDVRQPTGSAKYGITFEWLDNNNFYTFIVDPDNQSFVVWKYASGWVKLAEGNYTRVAVDHLKLERDGGAIRVYANDNMLAEVTDGTHTTGRVGLEIWPGSNTSSINPAEARFDNFVIQELP